MGLLQVQVQHAGKVLRQQARFTLPVLQRFLVGPEPWRDRRTFAGMQRQQVAGEQRQRVVAAKAAVRQAAEQFVQRFGGRILERQADTAPSRHPAAD
jgi:hypothetical protein